MTERVTYRELIRSGMTPERARAAFREGGKPPAPPDDHLKSPARKLDWCECGRRKAKVAGKCRKCRYS